MDSFCLFQLIICLLPASILGASVSEINITRLLDGRIVGGVETTIQQFPHQVSLQRNGRHFCGAILIHSQVLLTAAHCTENRNAKSIQVRAGSTYANQGGVLLNVQRIISNKLYNSPTKLNNDIALLILNAPLPLSSSVRPIALQTEKDLLLPGKSLFVSGWGSTSPNSFQASERLRYTYVQEIDQTKCMAAYSSITKVTVSMICAGVAKGGRDSCQGDSGGPLVANIQGTLKLIGVVSWGVGCANSEYPGVYTRVSYYENWIRNQMNESMGLQL